MLIFLDAKVGRKGDIIEESNATTKVEVNMISMFNKK